MIYSHRGNLNGKNPKTENTVHQILLAFSKDFLVEADIWKIGKKLFLGHDEPKEKVTEKFIKDNQNLLLFHCKNFAAVEYFSEENYSYGEKYHFFWHQNDDYTITSDGYLINYPGKQFIKKGKCIIMLPELSCSVSDLKLVENICTDYPETYKELL